MSPTRKRSNSFTYSSNSVVIIVNKLAVSSDRPSELNQQQDTYIPNANPANIPLSTINDVSSDSSFSFSTPTPQRQTNTTVIALPKPMASIFSRYLKEAHGHKTEKTLSISSSQESPHSPIDSKSATTPREETHFNPNIHHSKSDTNLLIDEEGHRLHSTFVV